ncbi:MAG: hypothetical protein IPH20_07465 [Bacteroidales bacterium]|nr:hypothetical protein [Bacteroidales bacterium]
MERKRLVVSYSNVTPEVLEAIRKKYPLGYNNHVIKVKTKGDDFFLLSRSTLKMPVIW